MSSKNYHQGSQAFAHLVPGKEESVNGNTGTLNFCKTLVDLHGISKDTNLQLDLLHIPNSQGAFGLPDGWTFGLPFVLPGKSLTMRGCTHAVDFEWADTTNYMSGLRYVNDHGMLFQRYDPARDLPHNIPGQYVYKMKYQDGSSYYFDLGGKMILQSDLHGNSIYCHYTSEPSSNIFDANSTLEFIRDSWGQKVTFDHQPGVQMMINLPDGSSYTVEFAGQNEGVSAVLDPFKNKIAFSYVGFATENRVISEVSYPTGLRSQFNYTALQYLDSAGVSRVAPAVQDHIQLDENGSLVSHTNYSFATDLGPSTYTGSVLGYRMSSGSDSLMDSNDLDYRYDVLVRQLDEKGTVLSAVCTRFNSLHLPMMEERYTLDSAGDFTGSYQTIFTYPVADIDKHAQTPYYSSPTCVEFLYQAYPKVDAPIPRRRVATKYDNFGNATEQKEELHHDTRGYLLQKTTTSRYMTTKWSTQLLVTQTVQDETTQQEYTVINTPTSDQRNIGQSSTTLIVCLDSVRKPKPWKEKTFAYDMYGRLISQGLAWSPGSPVPEGSVREATSRFSYEHEDGVLTSTVLDPHANATCTVSDLRIRGSPVIRRTLPGGQCETFAYDALGRMVTHTNEIGEFSHISYQIGPGENLETKTTFGGYQTLRLLDTLGRLSQLHDNGDPTKFRAKRVLKELCYDSLGRLKVSIDALGLKTQYTFDSLGRPLTTIDPDGNTLSVVYDDLQLQTQELLNGDMRKITILNAYSKAVEETVFADSSDSSIDYVLTKEMKYDGLQRVVQETLRQSSKTTETNASSFLVQEKKRSYDCESNEESQAISGRTDTGLDTIERSYIRDLFGNIYTYNKKTLYSDGRKYSHDGPVTIYDAANRFVELRDQLNHSERRCYDQNGWLASTTRFDGTQIFFTHDACGQVVKTSSPHNCVEVTYACRGRVHQVRQGPKLMTYEYTLDGSPSSVVYGDGLKESIVLDGNSRAISEIDVFGVVRKTEYDEQGHISKRFCNEESVEYIYGLANHSQGKLLEAKFMGDVQHVKKLEYDGFDRVRQESVHALNSTTLLETQYRLDNQGRLINAKTMSAVCPSLTTERSFRYDGVGQLVEDATSSSLHPTAKFQYDGNNNIVCVDTNGRRQTLSYNSIDQRTDPGFNYDANGRMVADGTGNKFTFDDGDRLQAMTASDGQQTRFEYHADNSLASRKDSQSTTKLFHSQGRTNAIDFTREGKEGSRHSLHLDGRQILASYVDNRNPTYFLEQKGSTALLFDRNKYSALTYTAYGANLLPPPEQVESSFGFAQEFKHPDSNLIYLRSRHYSSDHMSFISMDSLVMENRYAYCGGDPVNFIDPSGHNRWRQGASIVTGALVTLGVTALAVFIPPVGVAATVAIGAGVGSAASVLGSLTQHAIARDLTHYGWADFRTDLMLGAAVGAVGGALLVARIGRTASQVRAGTNFRAARSGVGSKSMISVGASENSQALAGRGGMRSLSLSPVPNVQSVEQGSIGPWNRLLLESQVERPTIHNINTSWDTHVEAMRPPFHVMSDI